MRALLKHVGQNRTNISSDFREYHFAKDLRLA